MIEIKIPYSEELLENLRKDLCLRLSRYDNQMVAQTLI